MLKPNDVRQFKGPERDSDHVKRRSIIKTTRQNDFKKKKKRVGHLNAADQNHQILGINEKHL